MYDFTCFQNAHVYVSSAKKLCTELRVPQIYVFNPLPTRFNLTEFLPSSMHSERYIYSTSREEKTSKHGISIVLKLVSVEYKRRDISGSCVGEDRLTSQSPSQPINQGDQYGRLSFVYSWAANSLEFSISIHN